jgi:MFS family permease
MKFREELETVGFFYFISSLIWLGLGIMAGYWVLFYLDLGLSLTTIGFLFATISLSTIIFEIPTGAIADTFGRKISVGLTYILVGLISFGVLLSGSNIILLFILFFLIGIAWTLESGAFEAWFIDTVKHKKKSKHLHKLLGRWGSIGGIGFIIGPLIGGYLVNFGYKLPYLVTAILMFLIGIIILTFGKEHYFKRKKLHIKKDYKKMIKNTKFSIKYARNHPTIYLLGIISFFLAIGLTLIYNAYQPHVIERGLSPSLIGYSLSISGILIVLQLHYSHKIQKFFGGNKQSLIFYGSLMAIGAIALGIIQFLPFLLVAMIVYTSIFDMGTDSAPAFREILNKAIPSKVRATVLSVVALVGSFGAIIADISFGLLSDTIGTGPVIILGGIILLIPVLLYFRLKK